MDLTRLVKCFMKNNKFLIGHKVYREDALKILVSSGQAPELSTVVGISQSCSDDEYNIITESYTVQGIKGPNGYAKGKHSNITGNRLVAAIDVKSWIFDYSATITKRAFEVIDRDIKAGL